MCLPISNITECVNYAEEQAKKFGLRAPMVGHLGDGNFHVLLPFDPEKKEMYKKIREFNDLLIKKALELNGTKLCAKPSNSKMEMDGQFVAEK